MTTSTLHAALPARTAFVPLSGHSIPRTMSTLAARRTDTKRTRIRVAPLEEWVAVRVRCDGVVRTRMGLLFVGVKT
ncbi:hypothetical protein BJV78DRAFT_1242481 [Lactifluus subvellereus]|nr:hypothetical protein BJV78DRAFT_1242481 [Lactifluus subvellereus]